MTPGGPPGWRGSGEGAGSAAPALELVICSAARPLVGWDRVAVVLTEGLDRRLPLPGSDPVLQGFGDLQQSLAEGPGADVLTTGVPVVVDDLRVPVAPWTLLLASTRADFPVRSLAVLPLVSAHLRRAVSGVLIVARDNPRPFSVTDVRVLEALAGLLRAAVEHRAAAATPSVPQSAGGRSAGTADGATRHGGAVAGEEVAVVVGMLRERLGVDEFEAGAWLRAHAFTAGATIQEVAGAVLAGRVGLDQLTEPP